MKAISLWQPWASAMDLGAKRNETRSWSTKYRGDMVICSALRLARREDVIEIRRIVEKLPGILPLGLALCIVELWDCIRSEEAALIVPRSEFLLGNYGPRRFVWRTRNVRRLKNPIPVRGYQRIWDLEPEIEAQINAEL